MKVAVRHTRSCRNENQWWARSFAFVPKPDAVHYRIIAGWMELGAVACGVRAGGALCEIATAQVSNEKIATKNTEVFLVIVVHESDIIVAVLIRHRNR